MSASRTPRQWIHVGVIFALLFGLAAQAMPVQAAGVNYYVSPSGNNGNDCLTPATACLTIQAAIDKAGSGDIVNVAPGMYTERIVITKPLTLLGATAGIYKPGYTIPAGYAWDTTVESVINYPNPAGLPVDTVLVDIQSDNVVFRGFVVQILNARVNSDHLLRVNAQIPGGAGTSLTGIVIENNILGPTTNVALQNGTYGRMGLYLASPTYPAQRQGITNSHIAGNVIFNAQGNGNNIFVWGAAASYSSLQNADYHGTVIEDNDIYGSHRSGIEIAGGVSGLTIRDNRIHDNASTNGGPASPSLTYGNGIVIIRMSSDKANSSGLGINGLTLTGNEIYNNEKNGIYMGPIVQNVNLDGNYIHSNGWDGIRLDLYEDYHSSSTDVFNSAINIGANGVSLGGNGGNGMQVIGTPVLPAGPIDATNTWWGCAAGPGNPGCDTIAGAVNSASVCSGVNCTTYPVVTANPVLPIMNPGPTSFTIRFTEDVRDLYGGFHVDDVTNPANYLLVEDGANGTINTSSCSGSATPDDVQIAVNSAVYNALSYSITIGINGGVPLPDGSYRLLVCGSTSVVDLSGVPLNGGVDSLYDFIVGAGGGGVTALPATGFAPGQVTILPQQPEALAYNDLGDLWLEIPRLGVQAPIVGVPVSGGNWDVSWLSNQAGWLEGSAFPTLAGNSAITGHVYDANGQPGPFQRLNQLWYGDRIVVHAFGQEYRYEVRQVRQVQSNDTSLITRHEEISWLTLLTCRGYDEATNSYRYRVAVRAVLVEVK